MRQLISSPYPCASTPATRGAQDVALAEIHCRNHPYTTLSRPTDQCQKPPARRRKCSPRHLLQTYQCCLRLRNVYYLLYRFAKSADRIARMLRQRGSDLDRAQLLRTCEDRRG